MPKKGKKKDNKPYVMNGSVIQAIREQLGLSTLDILWVSGSLVRDWKTEGEAGQKQIKRPALSILMRFLRSHPSYLADIRVGPEAQVDIYSLQDTIEANFDILGLKMTSKRFGQIFGSSNWVGHSWIKKGSEPSPVAKRLFMLVAAVIKREGVVGLKKYIDIVEQEAQTREYANIEELYSRGWTTQLRNKAIEDAELKAVG